jgi:FAD/FMN-containing dehydrogenase
MDWVNDIHSALNKTRVAKIVQPRSLQELQEIVRSTPQLSVCGGKHAMGGQAFAQNQVLLDMTKLNAVLGQDCARGLLSMQAGAMWPDVIKASHQMPYLEREPQGNDQAAISRTWAIRQKQTGVDLVSLGGSVSANAHGRGLQMAPLISDVASLEIVLASGDLARCSRTENADLFSLVCGGYGLFGVIYSVTLRLSPRKRVERLVDVLDLDDAAQAVYRRVQQGCSYGDFQFAIDAKDPAFLTRGVFSCYRDTEGQAQEEDIASDFQPAQWLELLRLAHVDKKRAFAVYAQHYLSTHGSHYWSDTMQLATYLPSYSEYLDQHQPNRQRESLMIGEHYVPRDQLQSFMTRARAILLEHGSEVIYGTIRAIEPDTESFLPWAKSAYCCVVFNLRTAHDEASIARSANSFRGLIDAALDLDGSFFLTYHRWWTRAQLLRAYPKIFDFVRAKRSIDPSEKFVSDWYTHLKNVLELQHAQ